jgi:ribosomal protein S27AE
MSLADAPNGRVAGHLTERLDAVSEKQRPTSHPRCSKCGLGAGMAAADHDDIEFRWELHGMWHFTRRAKATRFLGLVSRGTGLVLQCSKTY